MKPVMKRWRSTGGLKHEKQAKHQAANERFPSLRRRTEQ
jgi:hypothetical protein